MKEALFDKYYSLLVEWNNKFNLTTITDREKVELLHFKDSLLGSEFIPPKAELLDIGSGAGFPAIPLKIDRDDIKVTMIDSVGKKVNFLNEVIASLGLTDITALHKRAEELGKVSFDVVTSRAVAPLNVLVEYCLPYVKKGGIMLAYKAEDIGEELTSAKRAIETLGGETPRVEYRSLGEIRRAFVIIKKVKDTPLGYPRGGNKPRLKPIV